MKDIIRIIIRANGLAGVNAYWNNAICIIHNIGARHMQLCMCCRNA